jgi:hypothetical protein
MYPEDLLQPLRKRPFEPFVIHVSDGTTYEVRHSELMMVGDGSVVIGVPKPNQPLPVYQRYETVSIRHIVRIVPLAAAKPGKNGEQG